MDVSIGNRITDNTSIYAGELTALLLALRWIEDNVQLKVKPVVILTDSLSFLHSIQSGQSTARPNLLKQLLATLNSTHINITFCWVPSHLGIQSNSAADHYAALAITAYTVELDIELELEEVYSLADRYILEVAVAMVK